MKKTFIPLLIAAFLAAAATSAEANIVESNVTVALKFYFNPTNVYQLKGNFSTLAYQTFSVTNANVIASLNAANEGKPSFPFPLNAKIIRQASFYIDGDEGDVVYLLRDKAGNEVDVTASLNVSINSAVRKTKKHKDTGVGSINLIATDLFNYDADPAILNSEYVVGAGISRYNIKVVQVKGESDLVQILNYSSKAAGSAVFLVPTFTEGVVEGSIKISGGKVIPQAAPDSN